jgi:uncharacterized protein YjiK
MPSKHLLINVFISIFFIIFINYNSKHFLEGEVKAYSSVKATLVNTTDTSKYSPPAPDTAGITYLSNRDRLLVSDSEVNEMPIFTGVNLFEISRGGTLISTATTTSYSNEPTGLSYNPQNNHIFVSDDNSKRIFEIDPGSDGNYGTSDDKISYFSTSSFGSSDPEGVAYGNGNLFIADGVSNKVFQTTMEGNLLNSFSLGQHGMSDPEGIAYNTDNGTLFVVDRSKKGVIEVSTAGELLTKIDISSANPTAPAGIVYAPASNSNSKNLYVVARGVDNNSNPNENDGKVYEFSFQPSSVTSTPTVSHTPGDANGDDIVDIQDYLIWLPNYYLSRYGPINADFNDSGFVDGIDYSIWNKNFTSSLNSSTATGGQ